MSPDSRLKARVKFLKGQLSVGQTLYFAPWDAYEMKEDEIRLEPVQIKHIPESGGAVKVLRANGQTCSFGINRNGRVEFHFGYLDSAPSSMAQAVFLSEERFWRWREFYHLLNELHASGIAECYFSPTDSGLKAALSTTSWRTKIRTIKMCPVPAAVSQTRRAHWFVRAASVKRASRTGGVRCNT